MNAKEYLSQALRIDQRINSKLEQVASLRELAVKASSTLSDTPRRASPDIQPMETIIAKILDLEAEINGDIDKLVDLKKEITDVIKSVSNPEYQTILEKRYLCFLSWEQIAVDMNYSIQYTFRMHDRALAEVAASLKVESKVD
ncbi:MAG TPA: DUF1492 domain-containing protein [Caproicibacter sp.]|nr:DUF1492 domain-containing protein [Caproicibacter sp.]